MELSPLVKILVRSTLYYITFGKQSRGAFYEGVSKSFRNESMKKYTLTTINTRRGATQRDMAAKLTRLTHKIAIQLYLVAERRPICSSRPRLPVRKLLDTLLYNILTRGILKSILSDTSIQLKCIAGQNDPTFSIEWRM
jgi:hypothetical protein